MCIHRTRKRKVLSLNDIRMQYYMNGRNKMEFGSFRFGFSEQKTRVLQQRAKNWMIGESHKAYACECFSVSFAVDSLFSMWCNVMSDQSWSIMCGTCFLQKGNIQNEQNSVRLKTLGKVSAKRGRSRRCKLVKKTKTWTDVVGCSVDLPLLPRVGVARTPRGGPRWSMAAGAL